MGMKCLLCLERKNIVDEGEEMSWVIPKMPQRMVGLLIFLANWYHELSDVFAKFSV